MPKRSMLLRWLPPILWMGVIFFASSLPGEELRGVSGLSFFGHLGEYAVLGTLLFLAARATWSGWSPVVFAAVLASLYGVSDEFHQFLTPGRTPDPVDWATDTLGAILGIGLVILVEAAVRRTRR